MSPKAAPDHGAQGSFCWYRSLVPEHTRTIENLIAKSAVHPKIFREIAKPGATFRTPGTGTTPQNLLRKILSQYCYPSRKYLRFGAETLWYAPRRPASVVSPWRTKP